MMNDKMYYNWMDKQFIAYELGYDNPINPVKRSIYEEHDGIGYELVYLDIMYGYTALEIYRLSEGPKEKLAFIGFEENWNTDENGVKRKFFIGELEDPFFKRLDKMPGFDLWELCCQERSDQKQLAEWVIDLSKREVEAAFNLDFNRL